MYCRSAKNGALVDKQREGRHSTDNVSCEGIDYEPISRTNLSAIQGSPGKEEKLVLTCQFNMGS
jgi:hypothetical protein